MCHTDRDQFGDSSRHRRPSLEVFPVGASVTLDVLDA